MNELPPGIEMDLCQKELEKYRQALKELAQQEDKKQERLEQETEMLIEVRSVLNSLKKEAPVVSLEEYRKLKSQAQSLEKSVDSLQEDLLQALADSKMTAYEEAILRIEKYIESLIAKDNQTAQILPFKSMVDNGPDGDSEETE